MAGIGTPQDALRVLAGLPMGELLGTLDILEQRGRLSEIVPFVDGGDADAAGRIRTALLTRELASMGPAAAQGAPLDTWARLVPVPIPVTGDARKRAPERSWNWELQPLTPAQQTVLATAAVGTALLILAMILLSPVGL